ncbi:hypothetical protein G4Y73_12450 [Wenzhouxiangella sp. XN201]|uniref:hypothetical protein n=1 Tax=Wenzhouxiangella sp. XN201 TaxID=2710755 RepID=UPI0013C82EDA|nr:hypothetical protein [Wenzhouxiangella sp. XN201]NEZ04960.1 hypothetical protein [Wenzhouxiangella sp. XN201]
MINYGQHRTFLRGLLLLALCLGMAALAQAGSPGLDGRAFDVEMLPAGADEPIANTLTFHEGTFLSAICVNHDFPQASYKATESGDGTDFEVHAKSYSKGHMLWEGTVKDGQLQATAVWHRPDRDEPVRFSISGKEKTH